jgi:hypothetical protein
MIMAAEIEELDMVQMCEMFVPVSWLALII